MTVEQITGAAVEICVETMRKESAELGYRCMTPGEFALCEGGIRAMANFICRHLAVVSSNPETCAKAALILLREADEAFVREDLGGEDEDRLMTIWEAPFAEGRVTILGLPIGH